MEIVEKIKELAQSKLASDLFVVDVLYASKKIPARLLVIVDGDKGVTIDQCADLSRQLSKELDDNNWIAEAFNLEVSTPGLDHPLKLKRQYVKNIGRELKIGLTNKKTIKGKLVEVTEENLVIENEVREGKKKELIREAVPFSTVEKAFVMVSFK